MEFNDTILEELLDIAQSRKGPSSFFEKIFETVRYLPFIRNDRNVAIRKELAKRLFAQLLTDDERAKLYGLPNGCRIREGAKILSPENLIIGEDCWIGENAVLDASGGLEIGSCTSIGLGVFIWSHSSHWSNLGGRNEIGSPRIIRNKTVIGSNCFIGGPTVILPGVTIGDKCVIRPMSRIDKDVPSRSVV